MTFRTGGDVGFEVGFGLMFFLTFMNKAGLRRDVFCSCNRVEPNLN